MVATDLRVITYINPKLFIGPYNGSTSQALSAASSYRNVLRNILEATDQASEEEWYLGMVPHPKRWYCDEAHVVQCWRFEFRGNWRAE